MICYSETCKARAIGQENIRNKLQTGRNADQLVTDCQRRTLQQCILLSLSVSQVCIRPSALQVRTTIAQNTADVSWLTEDTLLFCYSIEVYDVKYQWSVCAIFPLLGLILLYPYTMI